MRLNVLMVCLLLVTQAATTAAQTVDQSTTDKDHQTVPANAGQALLDDVQPASHYRAPDAARDLWRDEKKIWSSPLRLHESDSKWLAPVILANVSALSSDNKAVGEIPDLARFKETSQAVSSFGSPYPLVSAALSMYFWGKFTHNNRVREAGVLGSQALIHSIIVTGVLEQITNRQRPLAGSAEFWTGGKEWPSGHASMFWALSTVVAEQYGDHRLIRYGAYSLAAAVSISRFTGGTHYPSDALASSVIGYLVGRYVVKHHATDSRR